MKLHAAGASALRASVALKRSKTKIMKKARELGVHFQSVREQRKQLAERDQIQSGQPNF